VLFALMDEIAGNGSPALRDLAIGCKVAAERFLAGSLDDRLAASVPFLDACAVAVTGWQLERQVAALPSLDLPEAFAKRKAVVARYFADHIVPEAMGALAQAGHGAALLYDLTSEELTA
jgi:3-(methylthio)propanoyl-CoA dehydrogenase